MRRGPGTDDREHHDSRSPLVRFCADLADSSAFNIASAPPDVVAAVANAGQRGAIVVDGGRGTDGAPPPHSLSRGD